MTGRFATPSRVMSTALVPTIVVPLVDPPPPRSIRAVVIVDGSTLAAPPDSVLLAVGIDAAGLPSLVREAVSVRAAAVVVGRHMDLDAQTRELAATHGTAIVRLADGSTWQRAATAITSLLNGVRRPVTGVPGLDAVPDGDLFALADVICELVDAPVTIEDRNTHVLAFSARQDEADFVRIASILQRMRPHDYIETSMDAVLGSRRPVYLPASMTDDERDVMPRVAVAVRDGAHLLGSMWAVVPGPLGEEKMRLLEEAARVAQHHMALAARREDTTQTVDRMTAVLDGRADAGAAAAELGITVPALVVCVETSGSEKPAPADDLAGYLTRLAWRDRICSALVMHLEGSGIVCAAANLTQRVYAVVSLHRHSEAEVLRACEDFHELLSNRTALFIGLGRRVGSIEELHRSRDDADAAARALVQAGASRHVAPMSDLLVESLLLELGDRVETGQRSPSGAYARLLQYDAARGAQLVATVCAWLDAFGDVTAASAASGVHPNTFRYRLMRAGEIAEVDLADAEERFAISFQHRLFVSAR